MRARSRWPRFLLSRKNWRSCASAGARAGRITVSAWTIASSCARARFIGTKGSALGDARRDLLHHDAVARHREAQLHRQVMLVDAEPHVDDLLLLGILVAKVQRAHLAQRDLDLLDAE